MLHHLGRSFHHGNLADSRHVAAIPFHPKLEVLIGIEAARVDGEVDHDSLLYGAVPGAICCILRMTNSAGFSGAKPTSMLTMPLSMSCWVVVSPLHFT